MLDPQPSRPLALLRILERMLRDRDSGALLPVEQYEALFPGSETVVREEFLRCTTQRPPDVPLRFGRYEVVREIASGGQALVYEARDPVVAGRRVAVKVLRDRFALSSASAVRFRREVEVTSTLGDRGVCPIYDFGEEDGHAFIAMRLVEGETLAARFARTSVDRTPLDEREVSEALETVEKVARIVHVAHTRGVVHRDLKPSNIMVEASGDPVVLDFGLAYREEAPGQELTRSGDFLGTPAYMAPEQVDGSAALGPATDVHALGIVLYEWLARARPFTGPTALRITRALLEEGAVPIRAHVPSLSRDLELVLATALARHPAARYGSAASFADDLRNLRESRPITARRPSRLTAVRLWARREPWISGLTIALLLTVSIACLLLWSYSARNANLLGDYERLADRRRLEELLQESEHQLEVSPAGLPSIRKWQERAGMLAANLPAHKEALLEMRRNVIEVRPPPPDVRERLEFDARSLEVRIRKYEEALARAQAATAPKSEVAKIGEALAQGRTILARAREALVEAQAFVFTDPSEQWVHDQLQALAGEIERFVSLRSSLNTVLRVRRWGRQAEAIREQNAKPSPAWDAAIARVRTSPRYGGLVLARQVGLEPLGPDAESGLEEFAASFPEPVPIRDPNTGKLAITADTNVVFVLVPPGRIQLDGAGIELDAFFLGKLELTQAQYEQLAYSLTGHFRIGSKAPDGNVVTRLWPLESETWTLSDRLMRRYGWTLPTEAQWEFACRAGTTTKWSFGDRLEDLRGRVNVADATFARFSRDEPHCDLDLDDGHFGPAAVGSFAPNRFGFHEMHGNVAEWCLDAPRGSATTLRPGDGLRTGSEYSLRVVRGGSFADRALVAASGRTGSERPDVNVSRIGIRPARRVFP